MSAGMLVWSERADLGARSCSGRLAVSATSWAAKSYLYVSGEVGAAELEGLAARGADIVYVTDNELADPVQWVDVLAAIIPRRSLAWFSSEPPRREWRSLPDSQSAAGLPMRPGRSTSRSTRESLKTTARLHALRRCGRGNVPLHAALDNPERGRQAHSSPAMTRAAPPGWTRSCSQPG